MSTTIRQQLVAKLAEILGTDTELEPDRKLQDQLADLVDLSVAATVEGLSVSLESFFDTPLEPTPLTPAQQAVIDLVPAVARMRRLQRSYWDHAQITDAREAQEMEREVDRLLEVILLKPDAPQPAPETEPATVPAEGGGV